MYGEGWAREEREGRNSECSQEREQGLFADKERKRSQVREERAIQRSRSV